MSDALLTKLVSDLTNSFSYPETFSYPPLTGRDPSSHQGQPHASIFALLSVTKYWSFFLLLARISVYNARVPCLQSSEEVLYPREL